MMIKLNKAALAAYLRGYVQYKSIFTSVCQPHCSYSTHQTDVNYLQFTTQFTLSKST